MSCEVSYPTDMTDGGSLVKFWLGLAIKKLKVKKMSGFGLEYDFLKMTYVTY